MPDGNERRDAEDAEETAKDTRPQRAGEAGTTRLGMEDGDNEDIPATGAGGTAD